MNIKEIKEIKNYRNLSGCSISFDKSFNYIIGENNIGKTNILELLNSIFSLGKFRDTDFCDVTQPIKIIFTLEYDDSSIGFFEDNFDVYMGNTITLIAEQDVVDGRISYYHDTPNLTPISYSNIRKINILYYFAQRMPSREVDFKKSKGSGKVLNYLISQGLKEAGLEESDVITRSNIDSIISNINNYISSINAITGDSLNAYLDPSVDKLVSRLLVLGDEDGRELSVLGEGVQYSFNIILQVIETIYNAKISRKAEEFSERLVWDGEKKFFPIIMLLDEPEIHQHPYKQRNLMKKIEGILNNDNHDFLRLLKELFDIDGLSGQIFIATHSPNILQNNYKQFVRLYEDYDTNKLQIISGCNIDLDGKLYKHLLHNYIYLKEAMFSKKIVFVEGDSENGALPVFVKRKGFDLDENSVGVVKLDGADSVLYYMELYRKFGMKTYAIIDRDKSNSYGGEKNVFFTTENDYEEDVYESFELHDYLMCCKKLDMLQSMITFIKQRFPDVNVSIFCDDPHSLQVEPSDAKAIMQECKSSQLNKLRGSKNACKGALLAEYVTVIPSSFDRLIDKLADEV